MTSAEFSYNKAVSSTTGVSLFKACLGYKPDSYSDPDPEFVPQTEAVEKHLAIL